MTNWASIFENRQNGTAGGNALRSNIISTATVTFNWNENGAPTGRLPVCCLGRPMVVCALVVTRPTHDLCVHDQRLSQNTYAISNAASSGPGLAASARTPRIPRFQVRLMMWRIQVLPLAESTAVHFRRRRASICFSAAHFDTAGCRERAGGATATFSVVVSGSQPLYYNWQRGGTNLIDQGKRLGSTNATLTITNVSWADTNSYDVVVTNSYGAVTSSVVALTMLAIPRASRLSLPVSVEAGSTATFFVIASGTAPLITTAKRRRT